MLQRWRKRRALKRIARRLPRDLARQFGATDAYTHDQVRSALERGRYDQRYWSYAFAMFLLADDAAARLGGAEQVQSLRGEIADGWFHGDAGFSLESARIGAGADAGHHGLDAGGGFHDGGGGAGDGGASF